MYKCTDCSKVYNTNPEYCECGNNKFDKIAQTQTQETTFHNTSIFFRLKNWANSVSFEQKISVLLFAFFLVLSVIPWLIPIKTTTQKTVKKPVSAQKEIPSIDSIWQAQQAKNKPEEKPETGEERIIEVVKKVYVSAPQTPTTPTSKAVQPKVQKPVQKSSTSSKTTQKSSAKTTSVQKTSKLSPQEKKELENYKGAIRMALFNNLNVPSIQGSGECAVEFNVDSSGKLTNRNFTYQSDNKSLNDAVYYMLMRVPSFNPPPASYKGEKIKLKFRYNNGNIEVSFI